MLMYGEKEGKKVFLCQANFSIYIYDTHAHKHIYVSKILDITNIVNAVKRCLELVQQQIETVWLLQYAT